jgi:hypothetical protein
MNIPGVAWVPYFSSIQVFPHPLPIGAAFFPLLRDRIPGLTLRQKEVARFRIPPQETAASIRATGVIMHKTGASHLALAQKHVSPTRRFPLVFYLSKVLRRPEPPFRHCPLAAAAAAISEIVVWDCQRFAQPL